VRRRSAFGRRGRHISALPARGPGIEARETEANARLDERRSIVSKKSLRFLLALVAAGDNPSQMNTALFERRVVR
jgi:hypothetical protein